MTWWTKLILVCVFLTVTPSAFAQRVVVFRGPFKIIWDDKESEERSQMVADTVAATISKERSDLKITQLNEDCADRACLEEAIQKHDALDAIFVSTEQTGAKYEFKVFLKNGESFVGEKTGAFSDALEELKILIAKASESIQVKQSVEPPPDDTQPPDQVEPDQKDNGGLKPTAFWISLGITGALAVTWGALDIATHQRFKKLESGNESSDYWEKTQSLQTASRVFFTIGAVSIVTTTTLAFFTDFKQTSKDPSDKQVTIIPTPILHGGGLVIQGRF